MTSFALYFVFNVIAAISTSIGMFIVMRLLSGGAAASVQAVGAGTIADIWEVRERGQAMGIFYLGPLCGKQVPEMREARATEPSRTRVQQRALASLVTDSLPHLVTSILLEPI